MIPGDAKTIFAIVAAVRKVNCLENPIFQISQQFLTAIIPSAFAIFLQFDEDE